MRKILIEITPYRYLDNLNGFNPRILQKDSAKVLQMKYNHPKWAFVDKLYKEEVYKIWKKKLTVEQQKEKLIAWVESIKAKIPDAFPQVGWWDLKVTVAEVEAGKDV